MPWKDESGDEPPRAAGGPWGGGSGGDDGGKNGGSPWNRPGGGGSGGGGGDLEDQMRRMQERFRRGRGGGGGRSGQRPNFGPGGLIVLLLAALLAWAATGIVIVDEGERAAVFRFGKYQMNLDPGFHIRFPSPIETHEVMPAQSQQTTIIGQRQEESLMLTGDENIVDVQFRVRWFYGTKPEEFILNVDHEASRNEASALVKAVAESVMREVVGKSTLDQVITSGRGDIEDAVLEGTRDLLEDYRAGVSVSEIQLLPTEPPAPVRAAFVDVVNASQDAERTVEDATRFANEIIPRARGDAERILQDAEAYRDKVIADSTGEASRFEQILEEYRQAPRVTRERMYLETMETVLGNAEKLVLDNESGAVPYLPIDRVQRGGN